MPERFKDFADEEIFDGDKIRLEEILNNEILVTGYRIKESHQKEGTQYLTIHFEMGGKNYVTFTGSIVLTEQVIKYKSHLPFMATIRKINKHYTFT